MSTAPNHTTSSPAAVSQQSPLQPASQQQSATQQQSQQQHTSQQQSAAQQTPPAAGRQPLIFATNNAHKVAEIQSAIGAILEVISLRQAGIDIDIPEPHDSLEANATEKSATIHRLTGLSCFSEDTGLEVQSLGGAPGVKSARYAGESRSDADNIALLLANLHSSTDRNAQFRTVISLILDDQEYQFEGICKGRILDAPAGSGGFGYDPVFTPEGETRSFAQMTLEEKNIYSHRRKAADLLVSFLRNRKGNTQQP